MKAFPKYDDFMNENNDFSEERDNTIYEGKSIAETLELQSLGSNFSVLRNKTGDFKIWFSYSEPIAFGVPDAIVSENLWSNTTGKHMNIINPNKNERVERQLFLSQMEKYLSDTFK